MSSIDLGWGNPFFLQEPVKSLGVVPIASYDLFTYGKEDGDEALIKSIGNIIKETLGIGYKHILVTNGATQAINCALRYAKKTYNPNFVVTNEFSYPYYPNMIQKLGLVHRKDNLFKNPKVTNSIILADSPSNPYGTQHEKDFDYSNFVIWDSVYHSKIYNASKKWMSHNINVGSMSKILGVPGIRIGWIATDNDHDYEGLSRELAYECCTISKMSQEYAKKLLDRVDDFYFDRSKRILDSNRQLLQKLSYLLGDIKEVGMFHFAQADEALFNLFDKAKIKYIRLNSLASGNSYIRLNIGQTQKNIKEVVNKIKFIDRSK